MKIIVLLLVTELATLASCQSDQHQPSKPVATTTIKTEPLKRLVGAWVPWPISRRAGFGLLRINADSTGTYTAYGDRGPNFRQEQDTTRYYFSEVPVKVRYCPHPPNQILRIPNIEVQIWMYGARFDYELEGDTLKEIDKMGEQGSLVRLHDH